MCEGLVDGYDIHGWPHGPLPCSGEPETVAAIQRDREVSRDIELVNCAAGMTAEAAYRRVSGFMVAIGGGDGDMKSSGRILDAWYPDKAERRAADLLAERRAAALVRSASGSAAIHAMAAALFDRGEIDGDEIGALCRSAYGGRECRFGAWNDHWPPTLAQIRSGYIPEP